MFIRLGTLCAFAKLRLAKINFITILTFFGPFKKKSLSKFYCVYLNSFSAEDVLCG